MTQIPYRMPPDLVDFLIANSVATNEAQEIIAGLEDRSPEGSITEDSLKTITTAYGLGVLLRDSTLVMRTLIDINGEHSPVSPELRRKMIFEHAAISKRVIDELVSVYTAHERN